MLISSSRLKLIQKDSYSSSSFDILRWFAAAYVVIFHLRPVLFAGATTLHHASMLVKAAYLATSLGYQFVMLFFVLSGYLIASSVFKGISDGSWSWKTYFINRLTRLWLVLIPALILSGILAKVEMMHFHDTVSYFGSSLKWSVLLGNIFFTQGILVPNFVQNLPLWSLTYEFWYYMLFPCLVLVFVSKRWVTRAFYAILTVGLGVFLGKDIMLYFLIWLLGAALVVLPQMKLSARLVKFVALPITVVVLIGVLGWGKMYITRHHIPSFDMVGGFIPDFTVAMVFAALLYTLLHAFNYPPKNTRSWVIKISALLANFSYTLYLTHYPIVNLLRVWVGDGEWGVWQPDLRHVLYGLLILLSIFLYAYLLAQCTEVRTPLVRRMVMRFMGLSKSTVLTLPAKQQSLPGIGRKDF